MNKNSPEKILPTDALGIASNDAPGDPESSTIWVTGLYDSSTHRAFATQCLARVAQSVGTAAQVHSEWWSLDAFTDTLSHARAIDSSRSSTMLWFAGDGCPEQIDLMQSWLSECRHEPGERRALVTFLDGRYLDPSTETRLHEIAELHGLDLFCEPSWQVPTVEVWKNHCAANESFLPVLPANQPHQIRCWGLNE